ncbi:hypothetical protein JZ751_020348 [Albula glossodonta]|uniref:Pyroglutamyl-peptidase I n=1 Tax=Albula glossodonta TaxID=121402 RepID=A0A8T2NM53_9TELE|nr:hypothetical protein JZ751_020348 [Albula glossodonta]
MSADLTATNLFVWKPPVCGCSCLEKQTKNKGGSALCPLMWITTLAKGNVKCMATDRDSGRETTEYMCDPVEKMTCQDRDTANSGTPNKHIVQLKQYLKNPSWQAAQGLKVTGLGEDVEVYTKELPVSYVKAKELVALIWEKVNPKLAVHLGIAPGSKAVTLEQSGKNRRYTDRDVCSCCPQGNVCVDGGPDKLDSIVDMKSLTKHLKSMGLDVIYSRDAGRFLCDFVYYFSLYAGKGKAVLIHLPTSGTQATLERLVPMLRTVIMEMLHQVESSSRSGQDDSP